MITSYMLVLVFSAWLVAYGLTRMLRRVMKLMGRAAPASARGVIALGVGLAFLVVVAAPAWVILIAALLLAVPHTRITHHIPESIQWVVFPVALLPLMATSFAGAPSWIALDGAILISALIGARGMRDAPSGLGAACLPYLFIVLWLTTSVAMHFSSGMAHAS